MTEPREAVQVPADAGRCSNPLTTQETGLVFELVCRRCGAHGGEGWELLSQQSHCNRTLELNESHLRQGGWSYVYRHLCRDIARQAPTTEQIEQFWTEGADALPPSPLNDQLRASIATFPPSLRRLVDDEPAAEILDPTLQGRVVVDAQAEALSESGEQGRVILLRAQLMASLIHASRNLAQERVGMVHTMDRGSAYYCRECQASIEPDPLRNAHEHHRTCKTGLVFVLLSELSKLPAEFGGAA